MGDVRREFVADQLWFFIAVVTLPVAMLAGMLGIPLGAEIVTVLGWLLLTPVLLFWGDEIAAMVYGPEGEHDEMVARERDPVEELKRRYARGEIDETEFETRLERLLDADWSVESTHQRTKPARARSKE